MIKQFLKDCEDNCLLPDFQSAYQVNYSTETSLVRMANDILWAMEEHHITIIVILDLCAIFDTIDHNIFLKILENQFGVTDTALKWFNSYLRPRSFKVHIGDEYLDSQKLSFGVPQGSCSGANIFTCYCSLINKEVPESVSINCLADDHSLWKTFKAGDKQQETTTKQLLEDTFNGIKSWIDKMWLKLNSDKTECILFGLRHQLNNAAQEPLKAGPDLIELSDKVKYPQLWINVSLKVQKAMANFIKIKSIHKYITREACTTLVLMHCMSHLDYSDALLYGLPNKAIKRYQVIQNNCAKLVLGRPKYSSSTKALQWLYWLPIQQRITYIVVLLTFKCISKAAPKYSQELITIRKPTWEIMQSNNTSPILEISKIKHKTFAARSLKYAAPKT